jgi:hypothetical protein
VLSHHRLPPPHLTHATVIGQVNGIYVLSRRSVR